MAVTEPEHAGAAGQVAYRPLRPTPLPGCGANCRNASAPTLLPDPNGRRQHPPNFERFADDERAGSREFEKPCSRPSVKRRVERARSDGRDGRCQLWVFRRFKGSCEDVVTPDWAGSAVGEAVRLLLSLICPPIRSGLDERNGFASMAAQTSTGSGSWEPASTEVGDRHVASETGGPRAVWRSTARRSMAPPQRWQRSTSRPVSSRSNCCQLSASARASGAGVPTDASRARATASLSSPPLAYSP